MKTIVAFVAIFLLTACDRGLFPSEKKEVGGDSIILDYHPVPFTLVKRSGAVNESLEMTVDTLWFFHDLKKKCLYFTQRRDVQKSFSDWLPDTGVPAGRRIEVRVSFIEPLTYFDKNVLDQLSKQAGVELNKYKVGIITGYNKIAGTATGIQRSSGNAPTNPFLREN